MTPDELLEIFDDEHDAFLASCERAGLDTRVPSCPGWTVADLLYHVYEVQYAWHRTTAERRDGFDHLRLPARPEADRLVALGRGEHVGFAAMLRAFPADTPIHSWAGPVDLAWLVRRMAHETAVHRADADLAGGLQAAIDGELASDGVDEFLHLFLNARNGLVGGSVHLHCTDVPGEWTVRETPDGFAVSREHAKGDAAIRGAAGDILLALWRRVPLSACDVVGSAEVAERFVAASVLE